MKSCSMVFVLIVFLFAFPSPVNAQIETITFEESHIAWHYSGYWRNSNQGQYGSEANYVVGRANQTDNNGFNGNTGQGEATLDLSDLSARKLQIEICFVSHSSAYRSEFTRATIHTKTSDIDLEFSQIGQKNTKSCFDAGTHSNVTSLSVSNKTSDNKWATVDVVRVTFDQQAPSDTETFQSNYNSDDIAPTSELGSIADGEVIITPGDLGIALNPNAEFGRIISILDDIDDNGVREILLFTEYKSPLTNTLGHMVVIFLNQNRQIERLQYIDEELLKGTGFRPMHNVRQTHRTGDFDGNGVTDALFGDIASSTSSGSLTVLLFGKNDDTTNPVYTVTDSIRFDNAAGNLPFTLTQGAILGSVAQPYIDLNGNGVMSFFTHVSDVSGDFRRSQNLPTDKNLFVFIQPDSDKNAAASVLFTPSNVVSAAEVIGDVNNDSFPDVVTAIGDGRYGFMTHVSDGSANNFSPFVTETKFDGWDFQVSNIIKSGDIDGDGFTDIVLGGYIRVNRRIDSSRGVSIVKFRLDQNYQQINDPVILFSGTDYPNDSGVWRTLINGEIKILDLDGDNNSEIIFGDVTGDTPAVHIRYFN